MNKKLKETTVELKAAKSTCLTSIIHLDIIEKQKAQILQYKKEIATLNTDKDKREVSWHSSLTRSNSTKR